MRMSLPSGGEQPPPAIHKVRISHIKEDTDRDAEGKERPFALFDFRVEHTWSLEGEDLGAQFYDQPVWKRVYYAWILRGIADVLGFALEEVDGKVEFDSSQFLNKELWVVTEYQTDNKGNVKRGKGGNPYTNIVKYYTVDTTIEDIVRERGGGGALPKEEDFPAF